MEPEVTITTPQQNLQADRKESTLSGAGDDSTPPGSAPLTGTWTRFTGEERVAIGLFVLVLMGASLPYLPDGVCFSDGGDLQLAASTLGIMHPPGYAGYVSILHLLTWMPGVEPAYMVSLGCWGAGIMALTLGVLIQIRLGVNAWLAAALILGLLMWRLSKQFLWINLVAPEVYILSLALMLATVYLLMKHARLHRSRDLYLAAGFYGLVLANRPPVIFFLPFLLIAWWMISRQAPGPRKRAWKRLGLCALIAAVPGLYSLGYIWVRDNPKTPYNYIENNNKEFKELPNATDGPAAKWKRMMWHVTGREFRRYMNHALRPAWLRLVWVYKLFFLYQPWKFTFTLILLLSGAALVLARRGSDFVLLMGLAFANLSFVCTYRIFGQASDLATLLMVSTIFLGVLVSYVFPRAPRPVRGRIALAILVATCASLIWRAPELGKRASEDAAQYLHDIDMASLPPHAVICSTWRESPALWYDQEVLSHRPDITIINTVAYRWRERVAELSGRPLFSVANVREIKLFNPQPYRTMPYKGSHLTILWTFDHPLE